MSVSSLLMAERLLVKMDGPLCGLLKQWVPHLWNFPLIRANAPRENSIRKDCAMLENLKNIPWAELKQAHGNAAHVPAAIRGLASHEEATRQASYRQLDNYVVLQSDLYEAAAYIPPFLIEILSSPELPEKELIYDLLYEIGNGWAPPEAKLKIKVSSRGELSTYSEDEAPTVQQACREAVLAGIEVYLFEVENPSSTARSKAAELLASLPEAAGISQPRLEARLAAEKDSRVHALLTSSLRDLAEAVAAYDTR